MKTKTTVVAAILAFASFSFNAMAQQPGAAGAPSKAPANVNVATPADCEGPQKGNLAACKEAGDQPKRYVPLKERRKAAADQKAAQAKAGEGAAPAKAKGPAANLNVASPADCKDVKSSDLAECKQTPGTEPGRVNLKNRPAGGTPSRSPANINLTSPSDQPPAKAAAPAR